MIEKEIRPVVTQGGGWREGKVEEGGQKLQHRHYKINEH